MGSRGWFWVLFGVICFCLYVWGFFFLYLQKILKNLRVILSEILMSWIVFNRSNVGDWVV